jgi:hypothetical protein
LSPDASANSPAISASDRDAAVRTRKIAASVGALTITWDSAAATSAI